MSDRAPERAWGQPAKVTTVRLSSAAQVAVALAAVLVGVVAESAFWHAGAPLVTVVSDALAGWAFVAAGLIVHRRQPSAPSGLLMIAEGYAWFFTNIQGIAQPLVFALGMALGGLNEAILVHLMLALPSGRLASWGERAAVVAAYALALTLGLLYIPTDGPLEDPYRCAACTAGVGLSPGARASFLATQRTGEVLAVLFAVMFIALIGRRWARSTAPARRAMAPVWLSLGACGLLMASHLGAAIPTWSSPWTESLVPLANTGQLAIPVGLLWVALRMRMAQAAVGERVLQLGSALSPAGLKAALPGVVGDPRLELVFWGEPVAEPEGRMVTHIEHEGRPLALVLHDPALAGTRLMDTVAAAVRLVADRERLRRAADEGRKRVERDLHDGAQQRFVSLSMTLARAQAQARRDPGSRAVEATLARAASELRQGLAELRDLAHGLYPALLEARGLEAAVDELATRMPLPVDVRIAAGRWPPAVESTAYFVICEALANVAKHARATWARAEVRLDRDALVVEVVDDGAGGADPSLGSGLRGLCARVSDAGGKLEIGSPLGGGTRVRAELPCA